MRLVGWFGLGWLAGRLVPDGVGVLLACARKSECVVQLLHQAGLHHRIERAAETSKPRLPPTDVEVVDKARIDAHD